jgi:hypothetical protein
LSKNHFINSGGKDALYHWGAARSGKTTTAIRFLKEAKIAYFSLDYLMMGIANGIPELGVHPTEGDFITGQRLWKVVDPLMTAMVENEIDTIA